VSTRRPFGFPQDNRIVSHPDRSGGISSRWQRVI
jgi:hypothetical protein